MLLGLCILRALPCGRTMKQDDGLWTTAARLCRRSVFAMPGAQRAISKRHRIKWTTLETSIPESVNCVQVVSIDP